MRRPPTRLGFLALTVTLTLTLTAACTGRIGGSDRSGPPVPGEGPEAVLRLVISRGELATVELVELAPEGLPTFYQRLGATGAAHATLADDVGKIGFEGFFADPRRVLIEESEGGALHGAEVRIADVETILVVPVLGEGLIRLTITLPPDDPSDRPITRTFELDASGAPPEMDMGTARAALASSVDFRHVGGGESPDSDTEYILFVANSYSDAEAFFTTATRLADEVMQQDWYSEHTGAFSFYALYHPVPNALPAPAGEDLNVVGTAVLAITIAGWGFAPLIVGTSFPRLPDVMVAVPDADFRAVAVAGANVGLPGFGGYSRGAVLAHEIGHAFGGLGDEYPESGRAGDACSTAYPNIATAEPTPWLCLEDGRPYAALCGDGSFVGDTGRVLDCDNLRRPCPTCMMHDEDDDFCPVCRARMDTMLANRTGSLPSTDACNGVDDDLDGQVDESCVCDPVPPPPATCDASCDYCWLGTVYENTCPAVWNGDSTCDCGCQYTDSDCSATPPPPGGCVVNGACEGAAGETCSSCAADCGTCPPPPPGSCPSGDGLYCGSTVGLDGGTLYWCAGGTYTASAVCAYGCHVSAPGVADYCESAPPPPGPTCGDGSCGSGETCSSCSTDCGGCPPPPPTGCPSGDGWYCGSSVGLDGSTLYYCSGGSYSFDAYCSAGCVVMPPGVPDVCGSGSCPSGTGWYCGGSVGLDGSTLYYCSAGEYTVAQNCTAGCVIAPPGVADYCG